MSNYDPNPTILVPRGSTYAHEILRYALHLDGWAPDWYLDDIGPMVPELAVEAMRRRDIAADLDAKGV